MNLEAMLRVIGKWSLSGMAIASTQAAVPKIEFKELYFWEYSTKIREAVKLPLAYLGALSQQTMLLSAWTRASRLCSWRGPYYASRTWLIDGGMRAATRFAITATAVWRTFTIPREPGAFIDLPTSLKTTKSWHRLAR